MDKKINIRLGNVDARLVSKEYAEDVFLPEPPLDLIISNFYCFNSSISTKTIVKHLSPNLEMMLVFSFGNPVRISFGNESLADGMVDKVAIIGPIKRMLNYEITPSTDVIVVNFRLNGFTGFLMCRFRNLANKQLQTRIHSSGKRFLVSYGTCFLF